jgi:twitching motility two-component system response regulator PilH
MHPPAQSPVGPLLRAGAPGEQVRTSAGEDELLGKVMVVDDAVSELKVIESILKAAGHQVVSYQDGELLEDRVVEERPDLLLLDIVMPKRNGYEVLRGIRRDPRTKDTPVVFVSSKNQESDRLWGQRQGAADYLAKPFTAEQLLGVVRQFVK